MTPKHEDCCGVFNRISVIVDVNSCTDLKNYPDAYINAATTKNKQFSASKIQLLY